MSGVPTPPLHPDTFRRHRWRFRGLKAPQEPQHTVAQTDTVRHGPSRLPVLVPARYHIVNVTYGLILTWLFWPPLAGYLFWRRLNNYAWVSVVAPFVVTAMLYGMNEVDADTPFFLSLFLHGIVASRLIAEAFRPQP